MSGSINFLFVTKFSVYFSDMMKVLSIFIHVYLNNISLLIFRQFVAVMAYTVVLMDIHVMFLRANVTKVNYRQNGLSKLQQTKLTK